MFIIHSGSNAPETTNVLMGCKDGNTFFKDVTLFDVVQKETYNNFFNAVGNYATVNIENSPYELDVDHVTPESVVSEIITIDYLTLSPIEKAAIDDAVLMFVQAITIV